MAISRVPPHARESFPAGEAGLQQFAFCAFDASGNLIVPDSAGVFAVVMDDAPNIQSSTLSNDLYSGGYQVGVYYGVVLSWCLQKVILGATLAAGVPVMTDTNGHAVAATTGNVILGYTAFAGNSGDLAPVMLSPSIHP